LRWDAESRRCGSDWQSLLDAASEALSRLRAVHVGVFLMNDWKKIAADAWEAQGRKEAAHEYHQARSGRALIVETSPEDLARQRRLMSDNVSLNAAWTQLNNFRNRPTPRATIEAVMHSVRERGLAALKEPATAERLECCDATARAEINQRIEKLGLKL
jgi:hypothetical protein